MSDATAVSTALYAFAQGIDTRDWRLLTAAFTTEFEYDYSSHRAGSAGLIAASDWVAHARLRFETMKATQHTMTNPRVKIEGDVAWCRMYIEAWHIADVDGVQEWCTIGGEYRNTLARRGSGWVISRLQLDRRWTIGNPAVLDLPTGS